MNNICRSAVSRVKNLCLQEALYARFLPHRNTYILKRKYQAPLSPVNAKRPKILKDKYFIYELVEDTDLTEPPDLHVVLTSFVEGIGDVGDVISLIPQYAREHLLLPQKAVYATPENIAKYSHLKKTRPERPEFSSIYAGMTIRRLNKTVIPVMMNAEVPWTVEKKQIEVAFRIEGFVIPETGICLPDNPITGPDPTKEGKDFAVTLTLNNTEKIPVRCRIFHVKPGFESIKLPEECYLGKSDPIFEEQSELLNNMEEPEISDDNPASNITLKEKYRIKLIQ